MGATKAMGQGKARSWIVIGHDGKPVAIGVTFDESVLKGLPQERTQLLLELPKQAGVTALDHMSLDWNPHGHIPPGIYDKPHFDVHFYTISRDRRAAIVDDEASRAKAERAPSPDKTPPGYIAAPGSFEPMQGMHWVDPKSPELNGKPFTHTFIYGFHDGEVTFLEPMIASTFLETKANAGGKVPLPKLIGSGNKYYPTAYSVGYDQKKRQFIVALRDFVQR